MKQLAIFLAAFLAAASGQVPEVPEAKWSISASGGLRAEVPDVQGMSEVHLHFNVNKELPGVAAGDYNIMISSATNGLWSFEDASITVKNGDKIYYWILVMINGGGYQKTDLSFTLEEATTSTTSTPTSSTVTTTKTTTTTTTTTTESTTTLPPIPSPEFELIEPQGLKIYVQDFNEEVQHFAFHMNIDKPLNGIDFGDFNYMLTEPSVDGNWSIIEESIQLTDESMVHFWYYLVVGNHGYQIIEQIWSPGGPLTTTTPRTTTEPIPDEISVTETSEGKYYEPGELIFSDEFENGINPFIWEHEITLAGGGNWEFQFYTHNRTNSYTRDGILYLKPTLTKDAFSEEFLSSEELDVWGGQPADQCTMASFYGCKRLGGADGTIINPIMSARMRTVKSFTFKYGKVEARAKMPSGDWLWPAIWMLPAKHAYGQWPASGEIDIVESRGNSDLMLEGQNIGAKMAGSTLHFGGGYPENGWPNAHFEHTSAEGFDKDFHTYQVNWTPDSIEFSIDDISIGKVAPSASGGFWELGEWHESDMQNPWRHAENPTMAPFDQQFFLVINLAVGGTAYFPDEASNPGGKPWNNKSPTAATDFWNGRNSWLPTWKLDENNGEDAALAIDYIKIWASDVIRTDMKK